MRLKTVDTFHKTWPGYLIFGLVELGLGYLFASLAINSGSAWQWLLTFVLLIGVLQNLARLINKVVHGGRRQAE